MQYDEYKKLLGLTYKQPPARTDWFMTHVYSDSDLMIVHDERQRAVSALLLHEFDYSLLGRELTCAYICGSCTHPQGRGHGYAGQLLRDTLLAASDRGCTLCAVVPPDSALFFFYENFGFARAVFIDRQRYTAMHTFPVDSGMTPAEVRYDDFHRLELMGSNTIVHSADDFRLIVEGLDAGNGATVAAGCGGQVCAMAFGVPLDDGTVSVRALFSEDGSEGRGADAVLAQLRDVFGQSMFVVDSFPGRQNARLECSGMLRILDVHTLLRAVAAARHDLNIRIAVHDSLINHNNGVFTLYDGECHRAGAGMRADLDVGVDVLVRILCSSPSMASIMGLPGDYARLPLMF